MKTETYVCAGCTAKAERPIVRGQRPSWCPDCRKRNVRMTACAGCREVKPIYGGAKYCSATCRPKRKTKPVQLALVFDKRSDIRRAYEDGDPKLLLDAIRRDCRVDEAGCWVWQRQTSKGYPVFRYSKGEFQVHRAVIEAAHGAPLGTQAAHHICANTLCVNPGHLQPVTHRDNIAEMMARKSYLNRIAELEAALREVAPTHPTLNVIAVA